VYSASWSRGTFLWHHPAASSCGIILRHHPEGLLAALRHGMGMGMVMQHRHSASWRGKVLGYCYGDAAGVMRLVIVMVMRLVIVMVMRLVIVMVMRLVIVMVMRLVIVMVMRLVTRQHDGADD
jgi:hypothetical protein